MKKAKLVFHILMRYETEVAEDNLDDGYTIMDEIKLQREYLETQSEDLHDALSQSKLIHVSIEEVEHRDEPEFINDFQI